MPRTAHGDADVGLPQRRGVVDPVSGHRDDVTARLQRLDQSQLLLRGDSGEHVGAFDGAGVRIVVQLGKLSTADHFAVAVRVDDTDLSGDRAGGADVVTGDHLHVDSRGVAGGDG